MLINITGDSYTYHKTKSIFYDNVPKSAVWSEEPVKVPFSNSVAQSTNVHTRPNHDAACINVYNI